MSGSKGTTNVLNYKVHQKLLFITSYYAVAGSVIHYLDILHRGMDHFYKLSKEFTSREIKSFGKIFFKRSILTSGDLASHAL